MVLIQSEVAKTGDKAQTAQELGARHFLQVNASFGDWESV